MLNRKNCYINEFPQLFTTATSIAFVQFNHTIRLFVIFLYRFRKTYDYYIRIIHILHSKSYWFDIRNEGNTCTYFTDIWQCIYAWLFKLFRIFINKFTITNLPQFSVHYTLLVLLWTENRSVYRNIVNIKIKFVLLKMK